MSEMVKLPIITNKVQNEIRDLIILSMKENYQYINNDLADYRLRQIVGSLVENIFKIIPVPFELHT